MSTVGRTLQAVKPHIPLIKFPVRGTDGTKVAAGSMLQSVSQASQSSNSTVTTTTTKPAASSKLVGSSVRGTGLDEIPSKYRRKIMSQEEMEYIERGGPE